MVKRSLLCGDEMVNNKQSWIWLKLKMEWKWMECWLDSEVLKKKCYEGGWVYVLLVGLVQVAFLINIALGIKFPICTAWNAVPYLKG